jgi:hypothetical protein
MQKKIERPVLMLENEMCRSKRIECSVNRPNPNAGYKLRFERAWASLLIDEAARAAVAL